MNECGCVCCRFRAFAIMHRLCGDYAWIRRVCVYSRVCVCLHVRLSTAGDLFNYAQQELLNRYYNDCATQVSSLHLPGNKSVFRKN